MAQLSLYRRYRPRRFSEIRGQDHIVRAVRNAVANGSESHAYLFSGPRGTGKTSTARIFAKALNCYAPVEGEPCGECESCVAMDAGRSFDLFELDAASNNGVDAVRELVERSAVGSPGRTKVYILDEVHMLTAAASNALLKTLEEPPDHVRFVLATTDPQKVLPTIRSRTQHYEFQLLSAGELDAYVRWIAKDADLDLDEDAVAHVVRQGRGSARDTLSALDQVVAAGGVLVRREPVGQLFDAIEGHDTAMAITAVAEALAQGHDPRVLGEAFLGELRDVFLLSVGAEVSHLVAQDRERLTGRATSIGTPVLTRAMEALGTALVEMRQAADPRIPLEVALVRLTTEAGSAPSSAPSAGGVDDPRLSALVARVERLESKLRAESARPGEPPVVAPATDAEPATGPAAPSAGTADGTARRGAGAGRSKVPPPSPPPRRGDRRGQEPPSVEPAAAVESGAAVESAAAVEPTAGGGAAERPTGAGDGPDRDAIVMAFGDVIVGQLKGIAKALYSGGRFVEVEGGVAVFALDNAPTRDRAEQYRAEVEALLAAHFGRAVPMRLVSEQELGRATGRPAPPRAAGATRPAPRPSGGERPPAHATSAEPSSSAPRAEPATPAARRPPPTPPRARREPTAAPPDDRTGGGGAPVEAGNRRVPAPDRVVAAVVVAEPEDDDEIVVDLSELEDAADVATSGLDKLAAAFPGSELIEEGGDG